MNPLIVNKLEEKGLLFSGKDETKERMEIVELSEKDHPYFVAVQFHPEFKSTPRNPHPLFKSFIEAALKQRDHRLNNAGLKDPQQTMGQCII